MSRDHRPARVRPIKASDDAHRRRGDTAPVVIDGARGGKGRKRGGKRDGGKGGAKAKRGKGGTILLTLLFVAGAAGGGVLATLLVPA